MTFIPCNADELNYRPKSANYTLLKEFKESGVFCAKIEKITHKNAKSAQSCFMNTIRCYKEEFKGLAVSIRKDEVYLVNTNLIIR